MIQIRSTAHYLDYQGSELEKQKLQVGGWDQIHRLGGHQPRAKVGRAGLGLDPRIHELIHSYRRLVGLEDPTGLALRVEEAVHSRRRLELEDQSHRPMEHPQQSRADQTQ